MEGPMVFGDRVVELQRVILCIARLLRCHRTPVWRRCNKQWFRKVRKMDHRRLRRELVFLLSQCVPRQIARLYSKCFRRHRVALLIAGEYVTRTGLRRIATLRPLVDAYDEAVAFDNLIAGLSPSTSGIASLSGDEVNVPFVLNQNDGANENEDEDEDEDEDDDETEDEDDDNVEDVHDSDADISEHNDSDIEILEEDNSECVIVDDEGDRHHSPGTGPYRSARFYYSADGASTSAAADAADIESAVPDSTVPMLVDLDELQQQQQQQDDEVNSQASTILAAEHNSLTSSDFNYILENFNCESQYELAEELMHDLNFSQHERSDEQVPSTSGVQQHSSLVLMAHSSSTSDEERFLSGSRDSSPELDFPGNAALQFGAGRRNRGGGGAGYYYENQDEE